MSYTLSKKLKDAREAKGWTQTEAGARLGCSQKNVSRMESGERPSATMLEKMAVIYGLDLGELFVLATERSEVRGSTLNERESDLIAAVRSRDTGRAMRILASLII